MGTIPADHPELESFGTVEVVLRVDADTFEDAVDEYRRAVEHGYDAGLDTFLYNRCRLSHRVVVENPNGDVVIENPREDSAIDVAVDE